MVSFGWVREPEPASWLEGYTLPENPTLGPKLRGFEPVYPWDRPRPIPSETMISIKSLQPAPLLNCVVRPREVSTDEELDSTIILGRSADRSRTSSVCPVASDWLD